ncbi:MAG: NGG1p interacting factor NIF3 [Gammaproteobacteria bacterium]|nr:MAG: NGG1p interacting factor NIF3 [Gammaproteobacteria bacterium]
MYKLVFFVPESHLESVKRSVFEAGAGLIGNYENCCWQVKGDGQFRPLKNSSPYIGELDKLEVVEEYRVELVCQDDKILDVVTALKETHPYEEPAYDVVKLASLA